MKKAIVYLLCFGLLIPLAACGKGDFVAKTVETGGDDLAELSPAQLYERASENGKNLISSVYETLVESQGEEESLTTTRIRHGYEGFSYSRVIGESQICYLDGNAYLSLPGQKNYSVPCSARTFQDFLNEHVFPVGNLGSAVLTRVEKEGQTLCYEGDLQALTAPFSLLVSQEEGKFTPEKIQGEATFSQDLLIQKEVITVTGLLTRGEESRAVSFVLTTTLSQYRSDSITVKAPEKEFVKLKDLRILTMVPQAICDLKDAGELEATVLSSQTLTADGKSYSIHQENTLYKKGEGEGMEYYFSRQSLVLFPGGEDSQFEQVSIKGGTLRNQRYDLSSGRLLEEGQTQDWQSPWPGVMETFVLDFEELTFVDFSEEAESYTLKAEFAHLFREEWIRPLLERFFAVSSAEQMTTQESQVTLTIEKNSGRIMAISYAFSGSVLQGSVKGNLVLTVDSAENVTVPDLQAAPTVTPTP